MTSALTASLYVAVRCNALVIELFHSSLAHVAVLVAVFVAVMVVIYIHALNSFAMSTMAVPLLQFTFE